MNLNVFRLCDSHLCCLCHFNFLSVGPQERDQESDLQSGSEKRSPRSARAKSLSNFTNEIDCLWRSHLFLDDDFFFEDFFFGTLPPSLRASDNPMAIACLLLVTFWRTSRF